MLTPNPHVRPRHVSLINVQGPSLTVLFPFVGVAGEAAHAHDHGPDHSHDHDHGHSHDHGHNSSRRMSTAV